jgi:putative SOS response-associated peptidase YedK
MVAPNREQRLELLRWGFLIPRGAAAKQTAMARAESLESHFSFSQAFESRRCLLLADGFYEWRRSGSRSTPHYLHRPDGAPFTIAGIWQPGTSGIHSLDGCAVITRPARPPVDAVHDRMPALIAARHHQAWLDPAWNDRAALRQMLFDEPEIDLVAVAVGPRVNSPAHDDIECMAPVPDPGPGAEQLALFSTLLPPEGPSKLARKSRSPWR